MNAKKKIVVCFTLLPLLLLTHTFAAKKANRVAVNAQANPEYRKTRALDPSKKVQTYHVVNGKFFPGNTSDESMKGVTFMEEISEQPSETGKYRWHSGAPDDESFLNAFEELRERLVGRRVITGRGELIDVEPKPVFPGDPVPIRSPAEVEAPQGQASDEDGRADEDLSKRVKQ